MKNEILRIIDANMNRLREGLRVCEDISRFALNDKGLALDFKSLRHTVTRQLLASKIIRLNELLRYRDIDRDTIRFIDMPLKDTPHLCDIFMSNIERTKESLRVLEECAKVLDAVLSKKFRRLRFKVYDIEKRIINKTWTLSRHR